MTILEFTQTYGYKLASTSRRARDLAEAALDAQGTTRRKETVVDIEDAGLRVCRRANQKRLIYDVYDPEAFKRRLVGVQGVGIALDKEEMSLVVSAATAFLVSKMRKGTVAHGERHDLLRLKASLERLGAEIPVQ